MKKLLLITTLLLSFTCFAKEKDLKLKCEVLDLNSRMLVVPVRCENDEVVCYHFSRGLSCKFKEDEKEGNE